MTDMLEDILATHDLILIKRFNSFLSAYVCRVVDEKGNEAVLKVARPQVIEHEYAVMDFFSKQGMAPWVKRLDDNVLLMQDMGDVELRDDCTTLHIAGVAQMLQQIHQDECISEAENVLDYLASMIQARIYCKDFNLDQDMQDLATECFSIMQQDPTQDMMIHGDLHVKNIMLTGTGPRVIDPYGLWGNPIYDLAMIAVSYPKDQWQVYKGLIGHYGPVTEYAKEWFIWTAITRLGLAYQHNFPHDYRLQLVNECLNGLH